MTLYELQAFSCVYRLGNLASLSDALGVKLTTPPSSAQVKEYVELHLHSLSTFSWRGA
jgi:hypothetical protein